MCTILVQQQIFLQGCGALHCMHATIVASCCVGDVMLCIVRS